MTVEQSPPSSPNSATLRQRLLWLLPSAGIFLLLLILTLWFWQTARDSYQADRLAQLRQQADRVYTEIQNQIRTCVQAMYAARGVFTGSEEVTESEWREFTASLNLRQNFPTVSAIAFIAYVRHDQLENYLARQRAVGRPEFRLWPEGPRPDYMIVQYVEPEEERQRVQGCDVGAWPDRRAAMELARDLNEPVITDQVELIGRPGRPFGAVIYLPVYRVGNPDPDPAHRQAALLGWVAARIEQQAFLTNLRSFVQYLNIEVFDGPYPDPQRRFLGRDPSELPEPDAPHVISQLTIANHTWTIRCTALPQFHQGYARYAPSLVLACGILLSLFIASLVWFIGYTRFRAHELAERMTRQLRQSESRAEKLALVAARTDNAVIICDADGRIEWVNESLTRLTGYSPQEVLGREPDELLSSSGADQQELLRLRQLLRQGQSVTFETPWRCKDGQEIWVAVEAQPIRNAEGQITNYIQIMRDITARRKAEQLLLHNSTHDVLTGLPNRLMLLDRLNQCIQRARRDEHYRFAVLFLDLDRFKLINDSLGHLKGDQLLIRIAERLTTCLRSTDVVARPGVGHTVARLGGDEFVVLLDGINDMSDAIRVAERLQQELSYPINLDGQEVSSTVSIGIALSDLGYRRAEEILRDADNAMYRAKGQGKARYEVFDQEMHRRIKARLELESDLRRALERGEFQLYFQPIISLETRRVVAFEALVRWMHNQRGLISPADFIPVAEETGLVVPMGRWVTLEACRQLLRWQARFKHLADLTVAVNLSVRQLADPELVDHLGQILQATGLNPAALALEITESAMMEDMTALTRLLKWLKKLNVQLYLDDFGTGYSSLSCLHRFPIDGLKIDRAFIKSMDRRIDYTAVVHAIISLAHNLGMTVVAEGVENTSQLVQLQALECDHAQGYYFGKPMPSHEVFQFLASQQAVLPLLAATA